MPERSPELLTVERVSLEDRLRNLRERLSSQAKELETVGYPVSEDCRIDPVKWQKLAGPARVETDLLREDADYVARRKRQFKKRPHELTERWGELLEVSKTFAMNRQLKDRGVTVLRTAEYDDYKNGVDELIIDSQTRQVVAAVDASTDAKQAFQKTVEDLQKYGGKPACYGVGLSKEDKLEKVNYPSLPVFVISLKPKELYRWAEALTKSPSSLDVAIYHKILDSLVKQADHFAKICQTRSPQTARGYQESKEVFNRLFLTF